MVKGRKHVTDKLPPLQPLPLPPLADFVKPTMDQVDAAKAVRLRDLTLERGEREMDALRLYDPQEMQDCFHASRASERLLRAGNRAGKSLAGYAEDARAALGLDPYGKYPTDRPLTIWLICFNESQIGRTAYRLLFRPGAFRIIRDKTTGKWRTFRPWESGDAKREDKSRPAPPLIPRRYAPREAFSWKQRGRNIFYCCELQYPQGHPMQGTRIYAFPSGIEAPSGDPVDLIHLDEDLKYYRHLAEYQSRLSDTKGRLIWTAKPHMRNNALRAMSARAHELKGTENPDVEEFRMTYSGNPYIDAEEKRKRLASWNDEEKLARDQGEYIYGLTLVYPEFETEIHAIPSKRPDDKLNRLLAERIVPSGATRYMIVDPGTGVTAVLFLFVPNPAAYGQCVVAYDELYLRNCNARKFADAVAGKVAGHHFYAFIIDDHGSRARQIAAGKTVRAQYSEELRERDIRSQITGSGFIKGSDDMLGRQMEVHRWLTEDAGSNIRFRMFKGRCPNMVEEFANYKRTIRAEETDDKPAPGYSHLMNCLEYAAAYDPQYHPPLEAKPEDSPALKRYYDWQSADMRDPGLSRFLHGPGGTPIYLGPGLGAPTPLSL